MLGSASASVNLSGAVTASQLYSPYGGVRYASGILPTDYGFTHQRADAATGLDDYGARWYDPVAGQFTSADTTLAGGLNRYGYVGGNPESATDPSGHMRVNSTPAAHQYTTAEAMHQAQAQPVQVYAYQWAAPGSWGDFFTFVGQTMLGTDTLRQSFHTLFQNPHASTGDKVKAAGVGLFTVVSDVVAIGSLVVGQPEVGADVRSFDEGLLGATEVTEAATEATMAATDATTEVTDATTLTTDATGASSDLTTDASSAVSCGGLSFAASTLVATPHGEQPIASLRVGQQVEAYDPATGKMRPQTIVQVFLNHDSDRLDVTLATAATAAPAAPSQAAASSGHGRQAAHAAIATTQEVIHTTANHPWLTADHGWLVAGQLHLGESVRLLDGGTATVIGLRDVPGVGAMWDLSLDATHTFAVGDVQAVVHNCPPTDYGKVSGGANDLYHGTDIKSAKTMVSKGIDRVAAAQYGGDGRFYATTNLADARYFAEGNPSGGPPAIVGINLSTGLSGAVDQGILTPMEGFPGAYTVANTAAAWKAFNSIATFSLVDFER